MLTLRRWCAQAWREAAGDFKLGEQGILVGEGDGQDERGMGTCESWIVIGIGIGWYYMAFKYLLLLDGIIYYWSEMFC